MSDFDALGADFPQLRHGAHYLDTAASSLTPRQTIAATDEYYRDYRANIHRGLYEESIRATTAYEAARERVARFIGAEPDEIIFTAGSTHSANMLVRMLEESFDWKAGETMVTTVAEHHGTLVPLQEFARRTGVTLTYLPLTAAQETFEALPSEAPRIVSVMLASNVLGTVFSVADIARQAHEHGALILCDATAAVGHIPVAVKELGVDALWFSGHKMLGPTGIGVLYVRSELLQTLRPSLFGGGMIERVTQQTSSWAPIPARFEAGTPNIAGAIGLGAAVDYLENVGVAALGEHARALAAQAAKSLAELTGVRILGAAENAANVGIVSFVVENVHPHDIGQILADQGVAVRAGHHCAMPLHESLKIAASTRASFYLYNTEDDVQALVAGVRLAIAMFG